MASGNQFSELKHIGKCLYQSHAGVYYALVKLSGKQIKRSIKTKAEAKTRLERTKIQLANEGISALTILNDL